MPIYAYRCQECGHAKDVIQKFSDAPLTLCPACGADAFRKQLTAPAFQLKGSGWYVTDFRDSGKSKAPEAGTADRAATPSAGTEGSAGASGESAVSSGAGSGAESGTKSGTNSGTKADPAAASKPSAAPSGSASASASGSGTPGAGA